MANVIRWSKTALTGGAVGALDSIDGADLTAGDIAFVFMSGSLLTYKLNGSSSAAEDSPYVIAPDANPGTKRWELAGSMVQAAELNSMFLNLGLVATVGSKALTVALKGADGNDPSATNPVRIAFRDETLATGTPNIRSVTAALSVVLSSGSTLGFTAAEAGRIYVWAIDNAGTVVLGLSRTADLFPESNLVSTTAEGGAGAADSAAVMYSTAAQTDKACRCIGYIDITTGETAGEWDNAPTKIQIMGPGVKRTGDIVQERLYTTQAATSGTTVLPNDGSVPQISEGDQAFVQAITPTSAVNTLHIETVCHLSNSVGTNACGIALFKDAVADALSVCGNETPGSQRITAFRLFHSIKADTVSSVSFQVRYGGSGGTTRVNSQDGGSGYGGKTTSFIRIQEVMA